MLLATFTQNRNDLYWKYYSPEDGMIWWIGYDDAYWWNHVSVTEHAKRSTGSKTGKIYTLNHETNEVTITNP